MKRLILGLLFLACCKPSTQPTNETDASPATRDAGNITVGPDGLCSLLDGIDSDGTYRTICATIEEIVQIVVPYILTLRVAPEAGTPVECKNLPGTTVCATSEQRAKAILVIEKKRASFLAKDGGK